MIVSGVNNSVHCSNIFRLSRLHSVPHEYIVRDRVDKHLFVQLVQHIRTFGHEGNFYSKHFTYFEENGMVSRHSSREIL